MKNLVLFIDFKYLGVGVLLLLSKSMLYRDQPVLRDMLCFYILRALGTQINYPFFSEVKTLRPRTS